MASKPFFDLIKKRKSVRKFKDRKMKDSDINKIIDAARLAPSGMNRQPWEFIVITDKRQKTKIKYVYDMARDALGFYQQDTSFVANGTIIVACCEKKVMTAEISTALAIENILLAATALNLGSVVMTAPIGYRPAKNKIIKILKIPIKYEPLALIIIGYSDEKPNPKPKRKLNEIIHFEKW